MKQLTDCFGRSVRLTDERLAHILEHPEMKDKGAEIERVLLQPQLVRRSRSDAAVRLFYEFYAQTNHSQRNQSRVSNRSRMRSQNEAGFGYSDNR